MSVTMFKQNNAIAVQEHAVAERKFQNIRTKMNYR